MPTAPPLAPRELAIMKVIWDRRRATVRDVYEALREEGPTAYTTVMTMMNILERKRHLRKRARGRSFVYEPSRPKEQVLRGMVREFVKRVFDGSAEPLLVHLLEDRRLSEKDLEELARKIRGTT
jgi:BlaI family penicillinase repressor